MTVERDTRTGMFGTHLWLVDLKQHKNRDGRPRRLVLEPYSPLSIGTATRLDAWVEEEHPIYYWETKHPNQKPKGPPTFRTEWKRIDESSLHGCTGLPSVGFAIIRALARNELVGESAKEVMHDLFWSCFVNDTDGLNYLCKYADAETGAFYARQRLDWQLNQLKRISYERTKPNGDKDPVVELLKATAHSDHPLLALRAWERAVVEDGFYEALAAIAELADTEERTASTIAFLKLHKSKRTP